MLQLRHRLSLVVLLLLSVIHLSVPMRPMEQCTEWCSYLNEPSSCSDYQQVRVNKTAEIYRVRFCLDHQCNEVFTFNFRCCQICEACEALVPNGVDDCSEQTQCEAQMDTYLNQYCSTATDGNDSTPSRDYITSSITVYSESTPIAPTSTFSYVGTTSSATPNSSTENQSRYNFDTDRLLVITLGSALGLTVVLFCIACTGWMCTCRAKYRKVPTMTRRPVTYRSISGSGRGDSGYVDQAIVQGATPMPRYDQVTVGNNEGNTEGFYHVLESRDADHENSASEGNSRDGDHGGSFYHILENGQETTGLGENEIPVVRYEAVNLFAREDYDVLDRGHLTNNFDDVMSAILEVSSRAGTLLPARYDTVAPSLDSEDDYDVLDRRDDEYGSEEQTAKNSLSNKSQPRDHNDIEIMASAINLPYQEDADDYDTLESAQENNTNEDTYVEVTPSEPLPQETSKIVSGVRYGTVNSIPQNSEEDYDTLLSEEDVANGYN